MADEPAFMRNAYAAKRHIIAWPEAMSVHPIADADNSFTHEPRCHVEISRVCNLHQARITIDEAHWRSRCAHHREIVRKTDVRRGPSVRAPQHVGGKRLRSLHAQQAIASDWLAVGARQRICDRQRRRHRWDASVDRMEQALNKGDTQTGPGAIVDHDHVHVAQLRQGRSHRGSARSAANHQACRCSREGRMRWPLIGLVDRDHHVRCAGATKTLHRPAQHRRAMKPLVLFGLTPAMPLAASRRNDDRAPSHGSCPLLLRCSIHTWRPFFRRHTVAMGSKTPPHIAPTRHGRADTPPSAAEWLDALPEAVIGVDSVGRVCFANGAAKDLASSLGGAGPGPTITDLFGDQSLLADLLQRVRRGAGIVESDAVLSASSHVPISIAATSLGDAEHVVMILRRTPAARGDESSRTRAMRTFSHEIRNPLAGIRAAAQLIGRDATEDQAQLASLICEEVDRLGRLTERFDPLADDEPPRLRALNVHEPLAHVRKLLGSIAPSVRILERYDPSLPQILGDFDQLVQAFLNIAKNAVEASADQPEPQLVIATAFRPGIRVKPADMSTAQPQLEVSFVDNGPGIAPEIAGRMFEAFVTTKSGGMGLGLSIASAIVMRHGGAVEADSRPGHTEFRISLPIQEVGGR